MRRKKEFIRSILGLLVVTTLSVGTIGLADYYPRLEEERIEKEQTERIELDLGWNETNDERTNLVLAEGGDYGHDVRHEHDGCESAEHECLDTAWLYHFYEEGEELIQSLAALPVWNTVLQRRDWMHSSGPGFNNLFPWNDNHAARAVFPVSPIIPNGDIITLGEMYEHFWSCPLRRSHPGASTFRPSSEWDQRAAFRVWHATPNQRYHLDLVDGSSEPFPLSRWLNPHFQYAYVQYLHFNLNFCGNGLPSDVNHNFTRTNIMGSHYDRMFVFSGAGAGWEGHDSRYETLRNYLFPVSPSCEVTLPHPVMSDVQPVYSNLQHPDGYIFGGWFRTLAEANNHESEEGRMFERTDRVSTALQRTLYARWTPVHLEIPCEECEELDCICEDDLCEECEEELCICDENDRNPNTCEQHDRNPNDSGGTVCEECDQNLCNCEEVGYGEHNRDSNCCEPCTCEEGCNNDDTECEGCNCNCKEEVNSPTNSNSGSNSTSPQTGDVLENVVEAVALLATSLALIVGLLWIKRRNGVKAQGE